MRILTNLLIFMFLFNTISAKEILEGAKKELFELINLHDICIRCFYDRDMRPINKLQKIKLLSKEILKKDINYEFYSDVILIYAFSCDGLNYQYFFTDRSKFKDNVEDLFDLDEFEEPLQWLILGHYFTWIKILGNRSFGKIETEDGLKYFKKIIRKYPDSKYIDDAYLGMGDYYNYIGFYGRRINLPKGKQKRYIKRSIEIYENILKKFPKSNSILTTVQHLFSEYKVNKKKAEKFIDKYINKYRKKGKTEAVIGLLDWKKSLYRTDVGKQEEMIRILEEIYTKSKYKKTRDDVELSLIFVYQKTGKYDKLLKIYNKRLKEAKAKGDKKKIKNCKEWIKKIKKLKEKKNK